MTTKKTPMVSVWITAYNHESYVAKALDSVLMQVTNFDFEIVVGEDCSTDGTRDVLLEYQQKFSKKIKLLLHERNLGFMQNTVETWNACSGKYVALLDSDDYWQDPNKLQKQVDFLESHPEYSMSYHDSLFIDENENVIKKSQGCYVDYSEDDLLCGKAYTPTSATMIRNMPLKDIEYFKDSYQPDTVLAHYAGFYGKAKYQDNIDKSAYRIHNTGMWSSASQMKRLHGSIETKKMIIKNLGQDARHVKIVEGYITEAYLNNLFVGLRDGPFSHYIQTLKVIINDKETNTFAMTWRHLYDVVRRISNKIMKKMKHAD